MATPDDPVQPHRLRPRLASYPQAFLAEFPVMQGQCDQILPQHAPLLLGEPLPEDGRITLTGEPGFGLTLNPEVELARPVTRELLDAG